MLHLSSSKKTFEKKGNLPPNFRTPRLKQEYWVLSIFFAAAVPSCIIIASHSVWTRCPDWNHGQGGNMRSPLKPPSYNPCHPWDDFMRSRETCMCLCWAESGGCERSEVRSPTTPSRVCTMSRLYCFACVPNAESTNDMAHMQQSYFCPRKGCNIIVTLCEASRLVADDSVVFRFCSVGWTTDEMVLDKTQAVHPGFAILAIVVGWTQVSLPRACYMCVCSDVTDLIFIAWPCCARALSS